MADLKRKPYIPEVRPRSNVYIKSLLTKIAHFKKQGLLKPKKAPAAPKIKLFKLKG